MNCGADSDADENWKLLLESGNGKKSKWNLSKNIVLMCEKYNIYRTNKKVGGVKNLFKIKKNSQSLAIVGGVFYIYILWSYGYLYCNNLWPGQI